MKHFKRTKWGLFIVSDSHSPKWDAHIHSWFPTSQIRFSFGKTTAVSPHDPFLFFLVSLSLARSLSLCGNIHTSHAAIVHMLSVSLSVVLSVFHDLFTHFNPLRPSIFHRDGSMFSQSLINDTMCMRSTHTRTWYVNAYVSVLSVAV